MTAKPVATTPIPGGPAPLHEDVLLSPEWMTAILRPRHPGVQAIGIEIVERLETVATKVRFRVKYDGDPGNAPTALCAKGYLNPAMHEQVAGTVTEAVFYETIAAGLPLRTPPCVHAAVDPGTSHGLVVMTDLVEAGSTFLDPLGSYSVDQAAATLDQIAALHAATWERGATLTMPQFAPRIDRLVEIMSADALQQLLDDGRAPALGDSVRRADRLQEAVVALTKLDHAARCLVHGDVHTGNIYLAPDGLPGIIDWQVAQRGVWAIDVAYHIAAVLDPAVRAGAEVDLVRHYLDRLALRGGPVMPFDEAWWLYRAHLAYGFFMWAITRRVIRPVIEHLTSRLGQAAADHASFDLLGV